MKTSACVVFAVIAFASQLCMCEAQSIRSCGCCSSSGRSSNPVNIKLNISSLFNNTQSTQGDQTIAGVEATHEMKTQLVKVFTSLLPNMIIILWGTVKDKVALDVGLQTIFPLLVFSIAAQVAGNLLTLENLTQGFVMSLPVIISTLDTKDLTLLQSALNKAVPYILSVLDALYGNSPYPSSIQDVSNIS